MSAIDFTNLDLLQDKSWNLVSMTANEQVLTPSITQELHFGTLEQGETSFSFALDRNIGVQDLYGGSFTGEKAKESDDIEGLFFAFQTAKNRILSMDLTGTALTIDYSDVYSETYELIP